MHAHSLRSSLVLVAGAVFAGAAFAQEPAKAAPDGAALVAKAVADAEKHGKRALVLFAGKDCRRTEDLDEAWKRSDALKQLVRWEFVVVRVDAAKESVVAEKLGVKAAAESLPAVAVLDGAGKPIARHAWSEFWGEERPDAGKLAQLLGAVKAAPRDAETLLAAAIAGAKKTDRSVFVHFDSPN